MANREIVKSGLTPANEEETASIVGNDKADAAIDDSAEDAIQAIKGAIEKRDDSPNEC